MTAEEQMEYSEDRNTSNPNKVCHALETLLCINFEKSIGVAETTLFV